MSPRDVVYVGHMLDMALKAVGKTRSLSRDAYDADENLRLAVIHLVQVIGEAARQVSREFADSHPEIPISVSTRTLSGRLALKPGGSFYFMKERASVFEALRGVHPGEVSVEMRAVVFDAITRPFYSDWQDVPLAEKDEH